jgi:hypothetical protein
VSGLSIGTSRFAADDGSADPRAAAALRAFADGQGSEHEAIQALSRTRMLVPIVAATVAGEPDEEDPAESQRAPQASPAGAHRASEMSIPTLVGQDGRTAVLAFTSVAALARWRADARPVPTAATDVWQAAAAQDSAVVVDVAGPVPLAIDGARLSALARGEPVPPPHQDPDMLAAVQTAGGAGSGPPGITAISLAAGPDGSDLTIRLKLAPGLTGGQREQAAGLVARAVMARLGGRLRRGIAVAIEATD